MLISRNANVVVANSKVAAQTTAKAIRESVDPTVAVGGILYTFTADKEPVNQQSEQAALYLGNSSCTATHFRITAKVGIVDVVDTSKCEAVMTIVNRFTSVVLI